jgi:hypothetical protein
MVLSVTSNSSAREPNATVAKNVTHVLRAGCTFQFNLNVTYTPKFHAVSPSRGHYPATVTISGQGFAASGNTVGAPLSFAA